MARKETAKKEELRNYSEIISHDILNILKNNNINGSNIKGFLSEISESLNIKLFYDCVTCAHFAISAVIKGLKEKYKNISGSIIIIPTEYGSHIGGARYYVIYTNLLGSEIERVLKLKSFM